MSDDLDDLLAQPDGPGSKECHVCWALLQPHPDHEKLRAVTTRTDLTASRVADVLAARWPHVTFGDDAVRRHRRSHV